VALTSYTGLKTSIEEHLDRDDLSTFVDDFIDIAESRHKREVRFREMLVRTSLTAVTRYASLPTRYLEAKTLRLLTDPLTVLKSLNLHELNNRRSETVGKPEFFTVHAQIEFERTPDVAYAGEIIYYQELVALSNSNTTNPLLAKAPEIYLYSALAASAPWLMNDERIGVWETLYSNSKKTLAALDNKPIGPVQSQVSGPTP
jgi:hypothetical protein